jgi:hypothetical protein
MKRSRNIGRPICETGGLTGARLLAPDTMFPEMRFRCCVTLTIRVRVFIDCHMREASPGHVGEREHRALPHRAGKGPCRY